MPRSYVRLSAGRTEMSESTQALAFLAGANSIFQGDILLTADNPGMKKDNNLLNKLGISSEKLSKKISNSIVKVAEKSINSEKGNAKHLLDTDNNLHPKSVPTEVTQTKKEAAGTLEKNA